MCVCVCLYPPHLPIGPRTYPVLCTVASPVRGHEQVRRSTDHFMLTTRYSNQQGSKLRQNSSQVQLPENIWNLSTSTISLGRNCSLFLSEVLPVLQNLNYKLHKNCVMGCPSTKAIKSDSKRFPGYRRVTRKQFMRHFTTNGTDQCQNGS